MRMVFQKNQADHTSEIAEWANGLIGTTHPRANDHDMRVTDIVSLQVIFEPWPGYDDVAPHGYYTAILVAEVEIDQQAIVELWADTSDTDISGQ